MELTARGGARAAAAAVTAATAWRSPATCPGVVGVRDSKDPTGPALIFTPAAWRVFIARLDRRA